MHKNRSRQQYILDSSRIVELKTYLVWMFDMNTEAQLLKDTALRFDHLVLGVDVILIKNKRGAPGSTQKAKTADVNTC